VLGWRCIACLFRVLVHDGIGLLAVSYYSLRSDGAAHVLLCMVVNLAWVTTDQWTICPLSNSRDPNSFTSLIQIIEIICQMIFTRLETRMARISY
jgi:hypothetical protein